MAERRAISHHRVAESFARQVRGRFGDAVEAVVLYGSVARGEARRGESDVDLLVVHRDGVDADAFEDGVRDLAYDIELEHGVVLSLIVLSAAEYGRRTDRPFFRHVRRDAEYLHG